LRANYRRKSAAEERYQDTCARIEWISLESGIVSCMEFEMKLRLDMFASDPNFGLVVGWLRRYSNYAAGHQAQLDAQQETVLLEELNRLDRDEHSTVEYNSLLQELVRAIEASNKFLAERSLLDQHMLIGPASINGSAAAVDVSRRILSLKRKQTSLEEGVLDPIKRGLQSKLNDDDDHNLNLYGFPTDEPGLLTSEMHTIKAVLVDPYVPAAHCEIDDFFVVFLAQPWYSILLHYTI
jgi:hypothetical protein